MSVNGCDCSIVVKTAHCEMDIPYSEETVREAATMLQEEAGIEGDGVCRGIRKDCGVTGCVVTPLTIGTAPLLLFLAMGSAEMAAFVSETRNLYRSQLCLLPLEDTDRFDLIQDRNGERRLYEGCVIKSFELRVEREQAIKLKLDICGEDSPRAYPYADSFEREGGERFHSDFVSYRINGMEYGNIYGITLAVKKEGCTKTEIWIKRVLNNGGDLPSSIEEFIITAKLLRDKYEHRHCGMFRITLRRLAMVSDETDIDSVGAVMGPIRYFVAGNVTAEVFASGEGINK